jgi:L-ascorbate metabolism protein UlaG (beta-lactamase superfamily)
MRRRANSAFHAVSAAFAVIMADLIAPRAYAAAPDRCFAVAEAPGAPSLVRRASAPGQNALLRLAKLASTEARLTFIGHSTFVIESPAGVRVATDYNDYVRPPFLPEIVTMNRAHSSHYTDFPDPKIRHILRGWNPDGGAANHDISLNDVRVRNVPTNTRWGDNGSGYGAYGNSIFVFELADLCIGHLGHLHHTLTDQQLAQIGQLDVVLVPVDGGYTMDVAGMIEVLKALRARLIVPMHYFNQFTLNRFLDRIRNDFPVEMSSVSDIVLSQTTLPREPKILVLPGN